MERVAVESWNVRLLSCQQYSFNQLEAASEIGEAALLCPLSCRGKVCHSHTRIPFGCLLHTSYI